MKQSLPTYRQQMWKENKLITRGSAGILHCRGFTERGGLKEPSGLPSLNPIFVLSHSKATHGWERWQKQCISHPQPVRATKEKVEVVEPTCQKVPIEFRKWGHVTFFQQPTVESLFNSDYKLPCLTLWRTVESWKCLDSDLTFPPLDSKGLIVWPVIKLWQLLPHQT